MLKIYKLGKIGNLRSTSLFHAFARLDLFGLILVEPEDTYISLGYFDRADEILDMQEVLEQNLSWIERETGRMPNFWEVAELLEEEFKKVLPFDGEGEVPPEVLKLADQLKESLTSEDCIFEDTGRRHRLIKIREGIFLRNKDFEIDGQRLSISMIVQDQIVRFCKLEGLESKVLEREIIGIRYEEESIRNFLKRLSMAWLLSLFWD